MDGIRDSKTVNDVTHEYITQGGNVALERWTDTTGSHSLEFIYDNGGAPYSVIYDGVTYYYILNQQGDVVRIVDSTGATKAEYTYDAWGKILNVSNATGCDIGTVNPLRYRGYYYDTELGMYYVQSRYYDPVVKRMICADDESIVAGATLSNNNLFAYCDNNPVNRSDTGGECWNIVAGAVVGATSNAVTTMITNYANGESLTAGLASSMAIGAATGALSSIPGIGTVGEVVVNSLASGVSEAYTQYKNGATKGEAVYNVATATIAAGVSSLVDGYTPRTTNLTSIFSKATKKVSKVSKNISRIKDTLSTRLKKQGVKRAVDGIKTCGKICKRSIRNSRSTWKMKIRGGIESTAVYSFLNIHRWLTYRFARAGRKKHDNLFENFRIL